MNRTKKTVLIAMTVLGLSNGAFAATDTPAQPGGAKPAMAGKHHQYDSAQHKERMEKRQAQLHDQLKLSPNQEAAWKTFTAGMTPPASGPRPDRAAWENLSAPDRMEKMLEWSKQRQEMMASRLAGMKTFYAQLNPEQQKIFNDHFAKAHRHGGHHGMG